MLPTIVLTLFVPCGKGFGVVISTDLLLGWVVGRMVFGDGHPAIDYLLLLDVSTTRSYSSSVDQGLVVLLELA